MPDLWKNPGILRVFCADALLCLVLAGRFKLIMSGREVELMDGVLLR